MRATITAFEENQYRIKILDEAMTKFLKNVPFFKTICQTSKWLKYSANVCPGRGPFNDTLLSQRDPNKKTVHPKT